MGRQGAAGGLQRDDPARGLAAAGRLPEPRAQLAFREFTPEEAARWYAEAADRFPEPETEYGFFGRDLDVLRIEKALLTRRNILLVQGMGGSGKSTLLRHLAHWQELTGLVEKAFYFGWDERAWTRAQILRALAPRVLAPDVARAFDAMAEPAQERAIARRYGPSAICLSWTISRA